MTKTVFVTNNGEQIVVDDGLNSFVFPASLSSPTDPKLCPREIVFTIPGAPGVKITGVEDGAGNLDFTASATQQGTDLGGLFFQFNDNPLILSHLTVTGPQVTQVVIGDDNVL